MESSQEVFGGKTDSAWPLLTVLVRTGDCQAIPRFPACDYEQTGQDGNHPLGHVWIQYSDVWQGQAHSRVSINVSPPFLFGGVCSRFITVWQYKEDTWVYETAKISVEIWLDRS